MPRILIIDDDPTVRMSAELVLCALGFEAETAAGGQEGLARMRQDPPDLVICDIVMPGLDGFGVLASVQRDPRLARIPFIFLTSVTDREAQRRGMTSGADDFLTKPFQPEELLEAIQARLRKFSALVPDPAALDAFLAQVEGVPGERQREILSVLGADPAAPAGPSRPDHWIRRIHDLFDENDPGAIQFRAEGIAAKKLVIHAAYLLALLHLKKGDRARGEAEFVIADSVLKVNAERIRRALDGDGAPGGAGAHPGLRGRFLRLERKLGDLRGTWTA